MTEQEKFKNASLVQKINAIDKVMEENKKGLLDIGPI